MIDLPGLPLPPAPRAGTMEKLLVFLSTGLGTGTVKFAPGTVGSLLGPPLLWGLQAISMHPAFLLSCGGLLYLIGLPVCSAGIRYYQSYDPKHVVYDEIVAFAFVFAFVPVTWTTAIIGFVLFRVFDILKPWPIRRFERLPGEWGVMSDDCVAGMIAGLSLFLILRFSEWS